MGPYKILIGSLLNNLRTFCEFGISNDTHDTCNTNYIYK